MKPILLDRCGLSDALNISVAHIDRLRSKGLPFIRLGRSIRYSVDDVLQWARSQSNGHSRTTTTPITSKKNTSELLRRLRRANTAKKDENH